MASPDIPRGQGAAQVRPPSEQSASATPVTSSVDGSSPRSSMQPASRISDIDPVTLQSPFSRSVAHIDASPAFPLRSQSTFPDGGNSSFSVAQQEGAVHLSPRASRVEAAAQEGQSAAMLSSRESIPPPVVQSEGSLAAHLQLPEQRVSMPMIPETVLGQSQIEEDVVPLAEGQQDQIRGASPEEPVQKVIPMPAVSRELDSHHMPGNGGLIFAQAASTPPPTDAARVVDLEIVQGEDSLDAAASAAVAGNGITIPPIGGRTVDGEAGNEGLPRNAVVDMVLAKGIHPNDIIGVTTEETTEKFTDALERVLQTILVKKEPVAEPGGQFLVQEIAGFPNVVVKRLRAGGKMSLQGDRTLGQYWEDLQSEHALAKKYFGERFIPYTHFAVVEGTNFGDPSPTHFKVLPDREYVMVQEKLSGVDMTYDLTLLLSPLPQVTPELKAEAVAFINCYERMMREEGLLIEEQLFVNVPTGEIKIADTNHFYSFNTRLETAKQFGGGFFGTLNINPQTVQTPDDVARVLVEKLPTFASLKGAGNQDVVQACDEESLLWNETVDYLIMHYGTSSSIVGGFRRLAELLTLFAPEGAHNGRISSIMEKIGITNEDLGSDTAFLHEEGELGGSTLEVIEVPAVPIFEGNRKRDLSEAERRMHEVVAATRDSALAPKAKKSMREEALRTVQTVVEEGDESQVAEALSVLDTYFPQWLHEDRSDKRINSRLYGIALANLAHKGNLEQRAHALEQINRGILARGNEHNMPLDRDILRDYFFYSRNNNHGQEARQIIDGILMPLYQAHGFSEEDYRRLTEAHLTALDEGFHHQEQMNTVFEYDAVCTLDEVFPRASKALYDRRGIKIFTRFTGERLASMYRNLDASGGRFFVGLAESDNGMMVVGRQALEKLLQTVEKTKGVNNVDIWELSSAQQESTSQTTPDYSFKGAIQAAAAQNGNPLLGGFIIAHGEPNSIAFGTGLEGRIRWGDFTGEMVDVITDSFVSDTSLFFSSCETANEGGIIEEASTHMPNLTLYGGAGWGRETISIYDFPHKLTRNRSGGFIFNVRGGKRKRIAGFRNGIKIA